MNITTKEYVDNNDYLNLEFNVYAKYGITSPTQGIKKIWNEIPKTPTNKPIFIFLNCGAYYTAIVQVAGDELYGSVLILGYSVNQPIYMVITNGVWQQ